MFYLAAHEKPVVPEVASDAYSTVIGRTEQPETWDSINVTVFFFVGAQLLIQIAFLLVQYYNNITTSIT